MKQSRQRGDAHPACRPVRAEHGDRRAGDAVLGETQLGGGELRGTQPPLLRQVFLTAADDLERTADTSIGGTAAAQDAAQIIFTIGGGMVKGRRKQIPWTI
jgi:hypothetical protein